MAENYPFECGHFFEQNRSLFTTEHAEELRQLAPVTLPEHLQESNIAKIFRSDKYRLTMSNAAFNALISFIESKPKEGGKILQHVLGTQCKILTVDRAADDRFGISSMLARVNDPQDMPAEDEGIPGHQPGSANVGGQGGPLVKMKLGNLQMEADFEADVRAELEEEDERMPPAAGQISLAQEFEQMIKREDDDEGPTRLDVPYPTPMARDVALEVQKVKENRDRFKIEGRHGGIGPGVSVCMFTFHNTNNR